MIVLLKQIFLSIKGKSDAKNDRFQKVMLESYYKDERTSGTIYEKMACSKQIYISTFMMTELQRLKNERKYLIYRKIFKIHNYNSRFVKLTTFAKAINFIEKSLKDLQAQMLIKETEYKKKKIKLQLKYDKCKSGLATVYKLKEYEMDIDILEQHYLKEQEKIYMNAIFLLSEEVRMIEQMQKLLELKRNYYFLCIRYYYENAQMINNQLPVYELTDEVLKEIGELVEFDTKYEQMLTRVSTMEQEFKDKYLISTIEWDR